MTRHYLVFLYNYSFGPDLYMKGQAFCKCDALVIMTKPTFLTFDYMYNEQLIGSKGPYRIKY